MQMEKEKLYFLDEVMSLTQVLGQLTKNEITTRNRYTANVQTGNAFAFQRSDFYHETNMTYLKSKLNIALPFGFQRCGEIK